MRIIAGAWRGRRLQAPPGRDVRPTTDRVRESWFSVLGPAVEGARVLDLFSGSGALGLEALSRGAASVVFVEQSGRVRRVLEENVRTLGCGDRCRVVTGDALAFLRRRDPDEPPFDLALADPPYNRGFVQELVALWRASPFAEALWLEHRVDEPPPPPPADWTRRYGDTMISGFELPPPEGEDS